MEWTIEPPTTEGIYAYQKIHEWVISLAHVKKGDWRLRQNPEQLYAGETLVYDLKAIWLKLPNPPTDSEIMKMKTGQAG